jgi:hypothetical protein
MRPAYVRLADLAHAGLELGEGQFDGVQIGAVNAQLHYVATLSHSIRQSKQKVL